MPRATFGPGAANQISAGTCWPRWQVYEVTPVAATCERQSPLMCCVISSMRRETTLV
jgi:hypothetical protein